MADPKQLKSLEKNLNREAKQDGRLLDDAHKNLEAALKAEQKAFSAEEKAVALQEKLAKVENKASHKLVHARHKHDNAVTDQNKAQADVQFAKDHHARLESEVQAKKALLDQTTSHHSELSSERASKLSALRQPASDPFSRSGAGSENVVAPTKTSEHVSTAASVPPAANTATSTTTGSRFVQDVEGRERAQVEESAKASVSGTEGMNAGFVRPGGV